MAQLVHDLAPGARLGFASAFLGEVAFANAIRNLAALPNAPAPRPGFRADILVDDVLYTSSPMFSDGLVGQAVNEVAAAGVAYFSAAQNQRGAAAYFSEFRLVAANDQPTAGTNLNLSGVDPALYAGGFHNFREDGGRDIAQVIRFGSGSSIVLQWDDPYDLSTPTTGAAVPVAPTSGGTIGGGVTQVDFTFAAQAGTQYRILATRASGSPAFDPVVTIIDPTGAQIVRQDAGVDETVFFFAANTGTHTLRITPFESTTGDFTVAVNVTDGTARLTTDYNLLFFDVATGAFLSALAENNVATNRPLEIGRLPTGFPAGLEVQMVIARRFTPTAPQPARWLRYLCIGGGESGKYGSARAPATYGQSHARGAISVAAYSVFPPSIPQSFTSPGPATILFDAQNRRLARPEVRQKPDLAAYDDCNTTFFGGDSNNDADNFPNFPGTSAAAPNAAAIAALVLQAKGGPGSLTPGQLRRLLQASALPHDLDYHFARGTATTTGGGQVTLQWTADQGRRSEADANAARLSYAGPGSIRTFRLNLREANPTGGTILQTVPGLVFDPRPVGQFGTEVGFPFTLGRLEGLQAGDIAATFSDQAPEPSQQGFQFYQLNLEFTPGAFVGGRAFSFGVDRDLQRNADITNAFLLTSDQGNSADLLGQTVRLPDGAIVGTGARFEGVMTDGSTFVGFLRNQLGDGYSPLDGYGLIDAATAVGLPTPPNPTPFDDWKRENGLPEAAADNSDADADGLGLLLEYALDADPAASSPAPVFTSLARSRTFAFRRARAELNYDVETSPDLQSWSLLVRNPGTSGENVVVNVPTGPARTFVRLRVSR
ncbi:MAG: S8 family serine peptidase [Verrucomicrobia bacterium]|nr:S8 family serine peptidase [Verrucomicrobiota bacterium]